MTPEQRLFIQKSLGDYGYRAIAPTRHRWAVKQPAGWHYELSDGNHNEFGYDGTPFTFRDSPNSVFYVSYGRPSGPPTSLGNAMDQALTKIAACYGKIAILYSDTFMSRGLRNSCQRLGLDFIELRVAVEGHPGFKSPAIGPQLSHTITQSEYLNFAHAFGRDLLCRNPITIFHAMLADLSPYPVIFPTFPLLLTNQNYDRFTEDTCGPPYWTLTESENDYAIHRFLMKKGKMGVPNLWRYTPELVASWINSMTIRTFIAGYPNKAATLDTDTINSRLIARAFRDENRELRAWTAENYPSSLRNELDFESLSALREEARHRAYLGGLETTERNFHAHRHHIPLHRFLSHLRIKHDFKLGGDSAIYGPVEE